MTAPPLSDEDELAAVNLGFAVAKGADNLRKLAVYFGVDVDDDAFRAALDAALALRVVRYSDGCCDGGHGFSCELEIVR